MSSGFKIAINDDGSKVLYTEHLNQIPTNCPPDDLCCDNIPNQLNALVWIIEGVSSGNPPVEPPALQCELITLTKDSTAQPDGSFCWRGDATSGTWTDCVTPADFEVVFCCNNAQQNPDQEDCTLAITTDIEGVTGIRDEGCCCEPACWAGGMSQSVGTLEVVAPPTNNCGVVNEADVSFRLWIFDDTGSEVSCKPTPYPDVPPCPADNDTLIPCIEFGDVDVEINQALAHDIARELSVMIEGSDVEADIDQALAREIARAVAAEIAGADVNADVNAANADDEASAVASNIVSADCCNDIPSTMTCDVFMQEEPLAGPPALCKKVETGMTLTKESGHPAGTHVWSGNTTLLRWVGCVVPPVFQIRLSCVGTGTNCTGLMSAKINGVSVSRHDCSCDSGGAFSSVLKAVSSLGFTIHDSNACNLEDETGATADMGVYIRSSGAECQVATNQCGITGST